MAREASFIAWGYTLGCARLACHFMIEERKRYRRFSKASPEGRARIEIHGAYTPKQILLHGEGCGCHLCLRVWCIVCPPLMRVEWIGLTSFGAHFKSSHPAEFEKMRAANLTVSGRIARKKKSRKGAMTEFKRTTLESVAREMRVTAEIERASSSAVKAIPLDQIDDVTRAQVAAWVGAIKRLPGTRKRLFMEAIEGTTDSYADVAAYRKHLKILQTILEEASINEKPAVITKEVCFDPRIGIEIAKLSYALDRSWSFVVHLLALYGLRAIVEGLRHDGIIPPSSVASIPRPGTILAADEVRAASIARLLRSDDDTELEAYGLPDERTPEDVLDESTFIDADLGEEPEDATTLAEIYGD